MKGGTEESCWEPPGMGRPHQPSWNGLELCISLLPCARSEFLVGASPQALLWERVLPLWLPGIGEGGSLSRGVSHVGPGDAVEGASEEGRA